MTELGYLYRYEQKRYSYCSDPDLEIYGVTDPELICYKHEIIKKTPKGNWIKTFSSGGKRWVSDTSTKRFAYTTKEAALDGYIARKKAFVRHCKNRLSSAEEEYHLGISYKASISEDPIKIEEALKKTGRYFYKKKVAEITVQSYNVASFNIS